MSPGESLRGIKNKPEYNALETQRFLRRHNITKFKSNPFFPVNTLMLMRGAVAARVRGAVRTVFPRRLSPHVGRAEEDGRPAGLPRSIPDVRLDIDRIIARAQQDDVKKKLIENTNDAVARGTFGSPTFFVGDEIYFGKDSLREVEDEILAQLGTSQRKSA